MPHSKAILVLLTLLACLLLLTLFGIALAGRRTSRVLLLTKLRAGLRDARHRGPVVLGFATVGLLLQAMTLVYSKPLGVALHAIAYSSYGYLVVHLVWQFWRAWRSVQPQPAPLTVPCSDIQNAGEG